jgi:hypothetical protein
MKSRIRHQEVRVKTYKNLKDLRDRDPELSEWLERSCAGNKVYSSLTEYLRENPPQIRLRDSKTGLEGTIGGGIGAILTGTVVRVSMEEAILRFAEQEGILSNHDFAWDKDETHDLRLSCKVGDEMNVKVLAPGLRLIVGRKHLFENPLVDPEEGG